MENQQNPQIEKVVQNIAKTKEKISELQAKLRELELEKRRLEDRRVIECVRGKNLSELELAQLIELLRQGNRKGEAR